jgi:hypothetical protein
MIEFNEANRTGTFLFERMRELDQIERPGTKIDREVDFADGNSLIMADLRYFGGASEKHENKVSAFITRALHDHCGWPSYSYRGRLIPQVGVRGIVDYALTQVKGTSTLLLEVKAFRRKLGSEMILKYLPHRANRALSFVFGVLTNGLEWQLWASGRVVLQYAGRPLQLGATNVFGDVASVLRYDGLWIALCRRLLDAPAFVRGMFGYERGLQSEFAEQYLELFGPPVPPLSELLSVFSDHERNGKRYPIKCLAAAFALRKSSSAFRSYARDLLGIPRRKMQAYFADDALANAFPPPSLDE